MIEDESGPCSEAAEPDRPEGLRRDERLRRRSEFLLAYREGLRVPRPSFVLHVRPNGLRRNRLGLAVARKVGPAVTRNRVKRRLRDVFRRNKLQMAGGVDLVVNARPRAGVDSYWQLRDQLLSALAEARRRLASGGSRRGSRSGRSGPTRRRSAG